MSPQIRTYISKKLRKHSRLLERIKETYPGTLALCGFLMWEPEIWEWEYSGEGDLALTWVLSVDFWHLFVVFLNSVNISCFSFPVGGGLSNLYLQE